MVFKVSKHTVSIVWTLLLFLTACAQSPSYAPVKTVNQILKPNNGYIGSQTSPSPVNTQAGQQTSTNFSRPTQPNKFDRHQSASTGKSAPANVQKQKRNKYISSADKPDNSSKIKSNNRVADKSFSSKQQKQSASEPEEIKQIKNKPSISDIKLASDQKKPQEKIKVADKQALNSKKIKEKTSIVSIDNKKMLKLNFQWPLIGKVTKSFSQTDNKGIDIVGKTGQTVHAAEAGKAVYCGQGLIGFGNLAIIKHNETYLSAYANNSKLFVKEGQQVVKGQKIGQVGSIKLTKASLHFEIRKNGKAINPLSLLPKL